jgi:hypothetical protein
MEAISSIAHSVEQRNVKWLVDLGPKAANMGFDNAGLGIEMEERLEHD